MNFENFDIVVIKLKYMGVCVLVMVKYCMYKIELAERHKEQGVL